MKIAITLTSLILSVGALVYFMRDEIGSFKSFNIPTTISITNSLADRAYLDTITAAGLKVLGLDTAEVLIKDMPAQVKAKFELENDGLELKAFIDANRDGSYTIYVDNLGKGEAITILSHELVHLSQYRTKRLEVLNSYQERWLGQIYDVNDIPYSQRPWEKEAFAKEKDVEKQIKQIIY